MRFWIYLFLFSAITAKSFAQPGKPQIRGQQPDPIVIDEDQSYTVQFQNLEVRDRDNWFYPWGFSMRLYAGANYTVEGTKVIPAPNYAGNLSVPVSVNDGQHESNIFDLKFQVRPVNDVPVITGQTSIEMNEGESITITTSQLTIQDPDDSQFSVIVGAGSSYSVNNTTVTPNAGFTGTLSVSVRVSDGKANSNPFQLQIKVKPIAAQITGQVKLGVDEDQSLVLKLSDLVVKDPRNRYPTGYTLQIQSGSNYTSNQTTVTPARDFNGTLSVNVTINDGQRNSDPFPLRIDVRPVNDAPTVINLEETPILYEAGKATYNLSSTIELYDPDNDSLRQVEVGFDVATYQYAIDKLTFTAQTGISGQFNSNEGKIVFTGRATKQTYTNLLRSIQYAPLIPDQPLGQTRKIWIKASDGKLMGDAATREIKPYSLAIDLEIPTAFTPNGDHANDTWRIKALRQTDEYTKAVIRVYSVRGQMLYEAVGIDKEWDGTFNGNALPADSYFFTIDFGVNHADARVKGIVTILR